jgi:hypothetical protein
MLRKLVKWQRAKIRPDVLMESLPPSFLLEKALLFGRLGRHDDALRILYGDLKSLDLSLEYCDDRYWRQKAQYERLRSRQQHQNRNAFSDTDGFDDLEMKDDDNLTYNLSAWLWSRGIRKKEPWRPFAYVHCGVVLWIALLRFAYFPLMSQFPLRHDHSSFRHWLTASRTFVVWRLLRLYHGHDICV